MGNFGRALLGGIAGGAGAAEEVFDKQISSKEDQRKEAVLEKRQLLLQQMKQENTLARDKLRDTRTDVVTADNRAYKEEDASSGKTLDGVALSKRQLSRLSDADVGRTRTVQATADDERAKDFAEKKELAELRLEGQKEISNRTDARWKERYGGTTTKKVSTADKKFAKENAIATLQADFGMIGGEYFKDGNIIELPVGKTDPKMIQQMFAKVKAAGFNPTMSQDDTDITIRLGGFDYDQAQTGLAAPVEVEVVDDDQSKTVFDELYGALKKNKKPLTTPGSKMNSQQLDDGLKSSHGLAVPKQYPINNSQRSK